MNSVLSKILNQILILLVSLVCLNYSVLVAAKTVAAKTVAADMIPDNTIVAKNNGSSDIVEQASGTWFLSIDNDLLVSSDDDYTSGVQVGWVSGYLNSYREGPVFDFLANDLDDIDLLRGSHRQRFISHSLSHPIFTPGDIEESEYIEGDIPYIGVLFASLTAGAQDDQTMDAFSLHYGIAGPAALGEQTQNGIDSLIASPQ